MGRDQFRRVLDHLVADHGGELDIVNLTGGEPTLHPHLLDLLAMAREAGVHRVTVCSNGVRLARDEAFVAALGRLGARIALSFDTFDRARRRRAAGGAAPRDQAALPRPAREVRRRHDADPGDDPRRQRPRDRRHPAPRPRPSQHPPRRGPPHHLHRPGRRQLRSRGAHVDRRGAGAHRGDDGGSPDPRRLRPVAVRAPALLPDRLPAARPGGRAAAVVRAPPLARDAVRLPRRAALSRADAAARGGAARGDRPTLGHRRGGRRGGARAARARRTLARDVPGRPRAADARRRRCGSPSAPPRPSTSTRTWTRRPSTSSASRSAATPTATPTAARSRSAATTCSTARKRRRS